MRTELSSKFQARMFILSKEEHMAFKDSTQSNVKGKEQLDFVFVCLLRAVSRIIRGLAANNVAQ